MSNSQSLEFINVSEERSSSPAAGDRGSVVEDSLKDNPEVYQGGAVQTPRGPPPEDSDDELYSESPEARTRRLAKEALRRVDSLSRDESAATVVDAPSTIDPKKLHPADSQPTEGRAPAQTQKPQPTDLQPTEANGKLDATQATGKKSNAATASNEKRLQPENKLSAPNASTMSRPTAKGRLSAVEALRARRNGDADVAAASAQTARPTEDSNIADRRDTQQKTAKTSNATKYQSRQATQAPAKSAQQSAQSLNRHTTGESQFQKGRLADSISVPVETNQSHASDHDSDSSDELTKDYARPERSSHPPSTRGKLKTPKLKNVSSASRVTSQYDIEESPESVRSTHRSGGTTKGKKVSATGQRSTGARTTRRGRGGRANGRARETVAARRQRDEREQSQQPTTSRRGRMKAESNATPVIRPEAFVDAKGKAKAGPAKPQASRTKTVRKQKASKSGSAAPNGSESSSMYDDEDDDSANDETVYYDAAEEVAPAAPVDRVGAAQVTSKEAKEQSAQPSRALRNRKGPTSGARQPQAGSASAAKELQPDTPKVPSSSPPNTATTTAAQVDGAKKKPKIISWDRAGPQNQGSSVRKEAAPATRMNRFSVPAQPTALQRENGHNHNLRDRTKARSSLPPPDEARSKRSGPSIQTNVPLDVSDALAGFKKTGRSTVLADAHNKEVAVQPTADEHDFMDIDDFNSTTMMGEEDEAAKKSSRRVVTARTFSRQEMPPPPSRPKKPEETLPLPPIETHKQGSNFIFTQHPNVSPKSPLKRSPDGRDAPQQPAKRSRVSSQGQMKVTEAPEAPKQPIERLAGQQKPVSMPNGTQSGRKPTKRTSQRRERSHGSQKVDMQGSPIPAGMTLQENGTVLDSYSQQAGLSSDEQPAEAAVPGNKPSTIQTKVDNKAHPLPPHSRPAEHISSNTKRRPSAPEEESRGITKVQGKDPSHPLVEDETSSPATDPFTSNDGNEKISTARRTSSALFDELKEQIQYETVNHLRQHASAPKITDEAVASLGRNPFRWTVHEAAASTAGDNRKQYDPDTTLVNHEVDPRHGVSQRAPSVSTVSSSPSVPSEPSSPKRTNDVAIWRNALEPHQMKLFDGLVIVSHKLVRHLVDRETAEKDIADDYRRRATAVVEHFELRQAKEYQDALKRIKATKKKFHRELVKCSDKLKEQIVNVKELRAERKEAFANRETLEVTLQNVMAQVC